MKSIKELFIKYKSFISYAFFGVCTTLINMGAYHLLYNVAKIPNVPSTIIAWFLAVVFAFITNKLFVFDSKSFKMKVLLYELVSFFLSRVLTGVLDVVIMYVAVDVLVLNEMLFKFISNVIVIIINYILSRLVIFRKKKKEENKEKNGEEK